MPQQIKCLVYLPVKASRTLSTERLETDWTTQKFARRCFLFCTSGPFLVQPFRRFHLGFQLNFNSAVTIKSNNKRMRQELCHILASNDPEILIMRNAQQDGTGRWNLHLQNQFLPYTGWMSTSQLLLLPNPFPAAGKWIPSSTLLSGATTTLIGKNSKLWQAGAFHDENSESSTAAVAPKSPSVHSLFPSRCQFLKQHEMSLNSQFTQQSTHNHSPSHCTKSLKTSKNQKHRTLQAFICEFRCLPCCCFVYLHTSFKSHLD